MIVFPIFKINQVIKAEKGLELKGVISSDSFGGHKWVDDKWIGALKVNETVVFGRWYKQNNDWKFVIGSEDNSKAYFFDGQEVSLIDGYWGERVELVINKDTEWKEASYATTNRSDHDHCLICWATISEIENKQYMIANGRTAVCLNCFESYIKQGNFDFIVYPKN